MLGSCRTGANSCRGTKAVRQLSPRQSLGWRPRLLPPTPASTVETQAVAAAATGAPSITIGRTQWDALVDVAKLLGSATPYIAIFGLVVFGFLKFQELNQTQL
jgi:hypothetical protein